ncbi:nitrate/sulfonate/bicarbonate ABC transporter substrate-binding protein [Candidatus Vecturithrix granuli]|uniref:Nitrate/sulfonate/bicarbonate ABC transporter substrate-binding protein n=1 Tax=Vecturithrix granuli TaxID=1499967 RepID=A0A0S6W7H1_VECG1|nr:nitrate/sulfonate/bicarbonate ABC transporter substrate-binding protein [Candidatus Vecturithrix granuli]
MSEKIELWGVKDPNISAQLALAARLDLFKSEAGLDVSCKFLESGTTMPGDLLKAEQKPFAFTQTPITSIFLHDKGLSTKLLAPLADIAGTQQVIIHESSGISQPKDLHGKQIGMAQGAAVYIALRNMSKDCNVNLDEVEFVNLLPHDQLAAFGDGKLHAIACWEPWTTKAQTMGGVFYFSGARSEIPGMESDVNWLVNQSCLIVPDENLKKQPEIAVKLLKVMKKATDLINHRRKDVSKVLASFFDISRVELVMAMQKNHYSMLMDGLFRIGVLAFRDFLHENGRVSQRFTENILYDTQYLAQVDPTAIKLRTTASRGLKIIEKNGVYYTEELRLQTDGMHLKFLLADDSRYVRLALTQAVKIIGGEVIGEATTGREAIDRFLELRPNFVTMDLSMPGVSGVEAIASILHKDPTVNIIVISGTNLDEVREEVFNLGVKVFIKKPFDPMNIATIIGSLVM